MNEGIVVSGDAQVRDSALAAGRHARAELHRPEASAGEAREALEAILKRLEELQRLLARHEEQVPDARHAARDIADVRAEIVRARDGDVADGDRVRHALERLASRVGALSALAAAVAVLKEAILRAV